MYYNENEWVKGTAKPTSSFKSAEPRMLPTKAPASDAFYDAPAEKVHGAILDSNQPRLLPIKSETPGPGEYDSAKATASGKEASFSADQKNCSRPSPSTRARGSAASGRPAAPPRKSTSLRAQGRGRRVSS